MTEASAVFTPKRRPTSTAHSRAMKRLGLMLNVDVSKPINIVRISENGLSPEIIDELVVKGFSRKDINWIVPPRTLRHRREKQERLTRDESDKVLRAAKLYTLAEEVLGEKEKAMRWLEKPRKIFGDSSAMELMQTETGGEIVEEYLGQLDAGYFA